MAALPRSLNNSQFDVEITSSDGPISISMEVSVVVVEDRGEEAPPRGSRKEEGCCAFSATLLLLHVLPPYLENVVGGNDDVKPLAITTLRSGTMNNSFVMIKWCDAYVGKLLLISYHQAQASYWLLLSG